MEQVTNFHEVTRREGQLRMHCCVDGCFHLPRTGAGALRQMTGVTGQCCHSGRPDLVQEKSFAEETQVPEQAVGCSGGWTQGSD